MPPSLTSEFVQLSTGARNILYALDKEGTVWQLLTANPGAKWEPLTAERTLTPVT